MSELLIMLARAICLGDIRLAIRLAGALSPVMLAVPKVDIITWNSMPADHPSDSLLGELVGLFARESYSGSHATYYTYWLELIVKEFKSGALLRMLSLVPFGLSFRSATSLTQPRDSLARLTQALQTKDAQLLRDILANICVCDLLRIRYSGGQLVIDDPGSQRGHQAASESILIQVIGTLDFPGSEPLVVFYRDALDYIRGPPHLVGVCTRVASYEKPPGLPKPPKPPKPVTPPQSDDPPELSDADAAEVLLAIAQAPVRAKRSALTKSHPSKRQKS